MALKFDTLELENEVSSSNNKKETEDKREILNVNLTAFKEIKINGLKSSAELSYLFEETIRHLLRKISNKVANRVL